MTPVTPMLPVASICPKSLIAVAALRTTPEARPVVSGGRLKMFQPGNRPGNFAGDGSRTRAKPIDMEAKGTMFAHPAISPLLLMAAAMLFLNGDGGGGGGFIPPTVAGGAIGAGGAPGTEGKPRSVITPPLQRKA